jgi:hypothetical protein
MYIWVVLKSTGKAVLGFGAHVKGLQIASSNPAWTISATELCICYFMVHCPGGWGWGAKNGPSFNGAGVCFGGCGHAKG